MFAGYLHINNLAAFAVRHSQGSIFYIARFLTENGAQQAFFRGKFFFTLGRDLTDKNIVRTNLCADANDAVLIKVFDGVIAHVGNIAGYFFRSKFGVTRFHFVLFNVDGCKAIFLNQTLGKQDGNFKVAALP